MLNRNKDMKECVKFYIFSDSYKLMKDFFPNNNYVGDHNGEKNFRG
jgi:hypothetical protein